MARIRADYVFGTTDTALTTGDTTLSSAGLSDLPAVSGGDVAAVTLYDGTNYEIVHVTAHTAAATTATILRAQEGSTAQAWGSGATWHLAATAADFGTTSTSTAPATLLVQDGVSPLEPVTSDDDPNTWLYADTETTSAVTDHGALTGLSDDDHQLYVKGTTGRSYRMFAGVLRKTSGTWAFLDDSGHQPLNFGSVTASSTSVTINYATTATKVATLLIAPDETYAADHTAGASVGLSSATIQIYKDGVLQNPTTMPDSGTANFWIIGLMETA